ncbi:MAG: dihydrofolate synthase/folylpolyglutamate synthase, partial [Planctomycetota bacterium]
MQGPDEATEDQAAFDKSLSFLAEFTDYEQKHALTLKRESLDLGRMRDIAAAVNNPEAQTPFIHIAGSKGKGSATMITEALLRGQGLSTGRFLSPHLVDVTERIAIDGKPVSHREFARLTDQLRPLVESHRSSNPEKLPSFFESITIMSFLAFAQAKVDVAIVETGLGGRLDATNIIDPLVSVITMIDKEHTRVLGDTLPEIAGEKAGIIKENRSVISGEDRDGPAGQRIAKIAAERNAPSQWLGHEFSIQNVASDQMKQTFDFCHPQLNLNGLQVGILGRHQLDNVALALAAVIETAATGLFTLNTDAIRATLATLALPARVEFFPKHSGSLALESAVLLDSAHTPKSMAALAATITTSFPNQNRALLVGLLKDKDVEKCLGAVNGLFTKIMVTEPESPRALPAQELVKGIRKVMGADVDIEILPHWANLKKSALISFDLLVVTGSVYLAGSIRPSLCPV